MSFALSLRSCLRHYARFAGRAPRSEFWWFFLFTQIVENVTRLLDRILGLVLFEGSGPFEVVSMMALAVPYLAVLSRRLHDTGRSGWWMCAPPVPAVILLAFDGMLPSHDITAMVLFGMAILATLTLLFWTVKPGDRAINRFGPDPLAPPP